MIPAPSSFGGGRFPMEQARRFASAGSAVLHCRSAYRHSANLRREDMPRQTHEVRITLSVLDRLIDFEPDISREPPPSREKSMRILKQAVRRDLEWLLNCREPLLEIPAEFEELPKSIAAYGLPDFSSLSVKSAVDQTQMRRLIEVKLQLFEPRLIDPIVSVDPPRDLDRSVHFRISARLRVDPAPEPVTFDTTLNLYSGQYQVRGES